MDNRQRHNLGKYADHVGAKELEVKVDHSPSMNAIRVSLPDPDNPNKTVCLLLDEEAFNGFMTELLEAAYHLNWKSVGVVPKSEVKKLLPNSDL